MRLADQGRNRSHIQGRLTDWPLVVAGTTIELLLTKVQQHVGDKVGAMQLARVERLHLSAPAPIFAAKSTIPPNALRSELGRPPPGDIAL